MQKIKTFFITLFRSFTDPAYYNDVLAAKNSFSLKYFTIFYLALSLIVTIFISSTILTKAPTYIDQATQTLANMYPNDLEIIFDVESAEISTKGAEEPIVIPMPVNENIQTDITNLLVIDTSANAEDISEYQTAVLLTKTHLATVSESGSGFQFFALKEMADSLKNEEQGRSITSLTLNKSFIESNLPIVKKTANTVVKFLPYVLFVGLFIGYFISRLVYLLIMTIITTLLGILTGKNFPFWKLFQIGLHTVTVTDAITKVQQLLYPNTFPMLYSFAFLGITFIALLGTKPQPSK